MALERRAFCLRKRAERETDVYFPSLSARTLVYKGMLTTDQLDQFFPDLVDERVASALARRALAVLDQHLPELAAGPPVPLHRPQRRDQHRDGQPQLDAGPRGAARLRPDPGRPRAALPDLHARARPTPRRFDEVARAAAPGRPLAAARGADDDPGGVGEPRRDGRRAPRVLRVPLHADGAVGRPGLRRLHRRHPDRRRPRPQRPAPRRATGSPTTASSCSPPRSASSTSTRPTIVRKGRLQPGRMFLVDTDEHRIIEDDEIKAELAAEHPYDEWLHAGLIHLDDLPEREHIVHTHASVTRRQQIFGYTEEELRVLLTPMASTGAEPIGSMGTDTPDRGAVATGRGCSSTTSASCSRRSPTRRWTRSARSSSPRWRGTHRPGGQPARADAGVAAARSCCRSRSSTTTSWPRSATSTATATCPASPPHVVRGLYDVEGGGEALARAARRDLRRGRRRRSPAAPASSCSPTGTPTAELAPIPSLLLTGAVHHHLVREKTRTQVGLLVEAGDVREVHHVALLIGYGAAAVNPYLAMESRRGPRPRRLLRRGRAREGGRATWSRRSARACSR